MDWGRWAVPGLYHSLEILKIPPVLCKVQKQLPWCLGHCFQLKLPLNYWFSYCHKLVSSQTVLNVLNIVWMRDYCNYHWSLAPLGRKLNINLLANKTLFHCLESNRKFYVQLKLWSQFRQQTHSQRIRIWLRSS